MAINATMATIAIALAIPHYTLVVWITSTAISLIIGLLLVRAEHRRRAIDNFQLSRYVGTVSCRATAKAVRHNAYQSLLKKHKFRKRLGFAVHASFGTLCIALGIVVIYPDSMSILVDRLTLTDHTDEPLIGAATEQSAPSIPLLAVDDGGNFTIRSTNMVAGQNGHYRTELNVNCRDNTTSLLLSSADVLGTEQSTITIETKGRRLQKSTWYIHRDYHTAYAPAAINTLQRLDNQPQVDFLYKPFDTNEQRMARFDGELLSTAIASIRRDCHW
ncbi:MAG: hypothetical protein AAF404_00540 [Pseudomonadota bacterium]